MKHLLVCDHSELEVHKTSVHVHGLDLVCYVGAPSFVHMWYISSVVTES
jgi:hypothetical protein